MTGESLAWAIGMGLLAFVLMGASFFVGRLVAQSFKDWRESVRGPHITATDEELAALHPVWPLDPERWPSPMLSGQQRMAKVRCGAYARLAASRSRSFRYAAEVISLLTAAVLGLQLPTIAKRWSRLSESGVADIGVHFPLFGSLFVVAGGITVVMMCRKHSEDLETARGYYEQAARVATHMALDPARNRVRGTLARFRAILR